MLKYFETDNFQGEVHNDFCVDHVFKIGRFIGWHYSKSHHTTLVIIKEIHRSSYIFEYALVAGLTTLGADISILHDTTTQSVLYVTRTNEFDCGIMIASSHNPYIICRENSGHIILSKYANADDGIITTLKIMQVMCEKKARCSSCTSL